MSLFDCAHCAGTIPDNFCSWAKLQHLFLLENHLTGQIPACLTNGDGLAVNLTTLSLGKNSLIGPIPSSLFSFTHLREINLNNNYLDGLCLMFLGYYCEHLFYVFCVSFHLCVGRLPDTGYYNHHTLLFLDISYNYFTGTICGFRFRLFYIM